MKVHNVVCDKCRKEVGLILPGQIIPIGWKEIELFKHLCPSCFKDYEQYCKEFFDK